FPGRRPRLLPPRPTPSRRRKTALLNPRRPPPSHHRRQPRSRLRQGDGTARLDLFNPQRGQAENRDRPARLQRGRGSEGPAEEARQVGENRIPQGAPLLTDPASLFHTLSGVKSDSGLRDFAIRLFERNAWDRSRLPPRIPLSARRTWCTPRNEAIPSAARTTA